MRSSVLSHLIWQGTPILGQARIVLGLCFLFVFNPANASAQVSLQTVRISYSSTGINFMDLFLAKDK